MCQNNLQFKQNATSMGMLLFANIQFASVKKDNEPRQKVCFLSAPTFSLSEACRYKLQVHSFSSIQKEHKEKQKTQQQSSWWSHKRSYLVKPTPVATGTNSHIGHVLRLWVCCLSLTQPGLRVEAQKRARINLHPFPIKLSVAETDNNLNLIWRNVAKRFFIGPRKSVKTTQRRAPHYGAQNFWAGRLLIGLEFKIQPSDWWEKSPPLWGTKFLGGKASDWSRIQNPAFWLVQRPSAQ